MLLQRTLKGDLNADTNFQFLPGGLVCSIIFPLLEPTNTSTFIPTDGEILP